MEPSLPDKDLVFLVLVVVYLFSFFFFACSDSPENGEKKEKGWREGGCVIFIGPHLLLSIQRRPLHHECCCSKSPFTFLWLLWRRGRRKNCAPRLPFPNWRRRRKKNNSNPLQRLPPISTAREGKRRGIKGKSPPSIPLWACSLFSEEEGLLRGLDRGRERGRD